MVSVACSMNKSVCSLRTRCPSVLVGRTQCRPTLPAALTPITLSLTSLAGHQAILCGARHGGCKLLLADYQAGGMVICATKSLVFSRLNQLTSFFLVFHLICPICLASWLGGKIYSLEFESYEYTLHLGPIRA